jgi:hypothetical protein
MQEAQEVSPGMTRRAWSQPAPGRDLPGHVQAGGFIAVLAVGLAACPRRRIREAGSDPRPALASFRPRS